MLTQTLQPTDLLGPAGSGVSGLPHDRALDFTSSVSMGGLGPVGRTGEGNAFDNDRFQSFTVSGWFKTGGSDPIGGGARFIDLGGANMQVFANQTGAWTIQLNNPENTVTTITTPAVYNATQEWVFVAITYNGVDGRVNFYIGNSDEEVSLAHSAGVNLPDVNTSRIQIGNNNNRDRAFNGYFDDLRVFTLPVSGGAALARSEIEAIRLEALAGPAEPPAGPTFEDWRQANFESEADLNDPSISGPLGTPAGDGVANLLKYAFGFDALTPITTNDLVAYEFDNGTLRLVYPERIGAQDIEYIPEASVDLVGWDAAQVDEVNRSVDPDDAEFELVTVEAVVAEGAPRAFLRVRVEEK